MLKTVIYFYENTQIANYHFYAIFIILEKQTMSNLLIDNVYKQN